MAWFRVAAEGAGMTSREPSPPRWADAMLRSLLRPADRESISGDLLEEYRAARRPWLGALRANIWYVRHVLSMLWHLIRPCALVLLGDQRFARPSWSIGAWRTWERFARDRTVGCDSSRSLVRQSCASSWRLLLGRADLFLGRLPRLPQNMSDQDGDPGSRRNEFRRLHFSFHGHSNRNPGPASRSILQPLHLYHSRHVATYCIGLWCSGGRHWRDRRQMGCAPGARGSSNCLKTRLNRTTDDGQERANEMLWISCSDQTSSHRFVSIGPEIRRRDF
jgi:hypothetical protein